MPAAVARSRRSRTQRNAEGLGSQPVPAQRSSYARGSNAWPGWEHGWTNRRSDEPPDSPPTEIASNPAKTNDGSGPSSGSATTTRRAAGVARRESTRLTNRSFSTVTHSVRFGMTRSRRMSAIQWADPARAAAAKATRSQNRSEHSRSAMREARFVMIENVEPDASPMTAKMSATYASGTDSPKMSVIEPAKTSRGMRQ